MNIDAELSVWREQWQSETTVPLELRRKVARQSRFMKIALMADIAVTVGIGGGTALWALRSPQPDIVLLTVATWIFIAAAWTFSLIVNRGAWSPSGLDTAAFVDLSLRRCRGRLAATWFGAFLFVTQIVFCLGWVYNHTPQPKEHLLSWLFSNSLPIDLVWLATVTMFGSVIWYRRKKKAELAYLLKLREQMVRA